MAKFLIINDFNDINSIVVTHFSLDKGHHLAAAIRKAGHQVYFLTIKNDYEKNDIKYISVNGITDSFVSTLDYILVSREPLLIDIINKIPSIRNLIEIPITARKNPKIIIRSDFPLWFYDKTMRQKLHAALRMGKSRRKMLRWVIGHINYINAQNEELKKVALEGKIPASSLIISNMGVPNSKIDYASLKNPYDINHTYCTDYKTKMTNGRALIPLYYAENPTKMDEFNRKKYIIVYTGRIKVDGGKILFNMKNIMAQLGNDYELHIFAGSFLVPLNGKTTKHSARNAVSLDLLRRVVFKESKNVIIHYPYEHNNKYQYLHFADCGIDFSDVRPHNKIGTAGHAKILEYCEIGLPIVCEENINNLNLVRNGKNGIILPYLASDEQYVKAIKSIIHDMKIDREYCRKITVENENWDKKAQELLKQLNPN